MTYGECPHEPSAFFFDAIVFRRDWSVLVCLFGGKASLRRWSRLETRNAVGYESACREQAVRLE